MPLFGRRPAPQEELLEAARLAAIVQSSEDAIVSKRLDGVVLTWNPAAERIFGYTAEEMVGNSIFSLIPPDRHAEEQEVLDRISRGEPVAHFETVRRRKDGTLFPVELTISPIRDASGIVVGASSIKRDITQRRIAEETSSRLAAIVRSSDDAIISKRLDGTVLDWNAAAERMYGIPAAEMIGKSIYQVVPENYAEEEREILERVAQGEHVAHYETMRRRRDGELIDVALTLSPIRDATGTIVGASSIQRDITLSKRAAEAMRQASKMEAIGALAGGLAHDFNNQLYAVSGFAHFIGRDPGLTPSSRADLMELQKTVERMASLTRQLLAFARQQVLSPETLDLNGAVQDTQPMLQRLIGSSTPIDLTLAPGPKWVRVDRSQLVQVLLNLVINARDAMPEGGHILLRTETLEVGPGHLFDKGQAAVEPGAYAALIVADSGQGIPPEHLSRIFEPFYTTKAAGLGTGLGLATVEGVVSQSGGHIQIQSTVGKGTTIRILLPLTTEPPEMATTGVVPSRRSSKGRILVVDDEEAVRIVVIRMLQAEGYEVVGARNGREALRVLDEVGGAIDVVLTDVVMPSMGGIQLAEMVARKYPDIRLVWMSGHPRESEVGRDKVGQQPFLMKPVAPDALLDAITRVLDQAGEGERRH